MAWVKTMFQSAILSGIKTLAGLSLGILFLSNCGGTSVTTQVITPTIDPASTTVTTQTQQTFTASFGDATWSINGVVGGNATVGTITSQGVYTAPAVPPSPNTVTLTATSVSGPSESVMASVTVLNPPPLLASLTPAAVVAGTGDTLVTLAGSDFYSVSIVAIGGTTLTPTYLSSTQMTVTVPAALLASSGVLNLTVSNAALSGGESAPLGITVVSTGQVTPTGNLLVAQYSINSPRQAMMSVEFGPDINYGLKTWALPVPSKGGQINMLVAGMKSATTYHMRAILVFLDGTQFMDSDKTFTTGTVDPATVPQTKVTNPSGLMPSPGILMGDLVNFIIPNYTPLSTVAFDTQGNLIWYYDPGSPNVLAQPIELLPNGHLDVNYGSEVREIDLAGNIIGRVTTTDVTQWLANAGYDIVVSQIHHHLLLLPNGHLILLINSFKDYDNLPGYPGTTQVLGDFLVDLDPNHNVTWVWSTFDHLDVNRHPGGLPDWTHGNAVIYSPDDGNLLLSMRHQSWVIKIDYQDGKGMGDILWRLGYQGDFTIDSGLNSDWQYGQHYLSIASPNSSGVFDLLVYDNGDDRVVDNTGTRCGPPYPQTFLGSNIPGTIQCYTRAVDFRVDENARTVSTAWQYNTSPVYSYWGGSTQLLSTGNFNIDINTPVYNDDLGNPTPPLDDSSGARYLELTPDPTPQIAMQMEITNQNAYRLVHMPSLYPGVQW